jgi:hypothetical protein
VRIKKILRRESGNQVFNANLIHGQKNKNKILFSHYICSLIKIYSGINFYSETGLYNDFFMFCLPWSTIRGNKNNENGNFLRRRPEKR